MKYIILAVIGIVIGYLGYDRIHRLNDFAGTKYTWLWAFILSFFGGILIGYAVTGVIGRRK